MIEYKIATWSSLAAGEPSPEEIKMMAAVADTVPALRKALEMVQKSSDYHPSLADAFQREGARKRVVNITVSALRKHEKATSKAFNTNKKN